MNKLMIAMLFASLNVAFAYCGSTTKQNGESVEATTTSQEEGRNFKGFNPPEPPDWD